MKKKIMGLATLCMSVFLAFSATACGGGTGGGGTSTGGNKVTLTVTYQQGTTEGIITTKLAKAFENKKKAEGVDVDVKPYATSQSSYNSDLLKAYNSGSLADVVYTYDDFAAFWTKEGVFETLDSRFEAAGFDFSKYDEAAFESARAYDNKISYVPRSYDQPVVYVNKALFTQFGVEVPSSENFTWTKMMEVCAQLRKAMDDSLGNAAQYYYPLDVNWRWQPVYNAFVRSFGGYVYDETKENKVGFTQQGTINAIAKIRDIIDKEYTPLTTGGGTNFNDGKAAMYIMSRPTVSGLEAREITNVEFLPMPVFDEAFTGIEGGTSYYCYGTTGYALNASGKNKDLAWEFMLFVLSEEGQTVLSETGVSVPVIKSLQTAENAAWKTGVDFLKNVDQSAFVFDAAKASLYTRIPATFARGNADKERTIYDTIGQNLQSLCSATYKNETTEKYCADVQKALETAIR